MGRFFKSTNLTYPIAFILKIEYSMFAMENKKEYNDSFIVREGLSKESEIIKKTQQWFNRLIYLFASQFIIGDIYIHRALFICILFHENTSEILRCNDNRYIIRGKNKRMYFIYLTSDDSLPWGALQSEKWLPLGDKEFQIEWQELIRTIRQKGFMEFLKKRWSVSRKVWKILSNMSKQDLFDIETILSDLKNYPPNLNTTVSPSRIT